MPDAPTAWGALAAAAFALSFGGVLLVERFAHRVGLLDRPNVRSSHVETRPRGGGLGIVLAVGVAVAGAVLIRHPLSQATEVVVAGSALVALVGLWDDVRPLAVWPRLAAHTLAAVWVVSAAGSLDRLPLPSPLDVSVGVLGPALTVVWLVGATNFFNFMDGLDGLAGGQAVITLATVAAIAWPLDAARLALVAGGATLGFLVRNWSPARIFLGDVGSSFLGFLLAALPITVEPPARSPLTLVVAVSLALFLLDPVATLIARARRGAVLGAAHREHAYQQFVPPGRTHAAVVAWLLLASAGLSVVAGLAWRVPDLAWLPVAAALGVFTVEWRWAARHRRAAVDYTEHGRA